MKSRFIIAMLCLTLSLQVCSKAPIRAKCYTGDQPRWDGLFAMESLLKKHGLIFVEKNPDVLLCNKVTDTILAHNMPIIILEKSAAASVTRNSKKSLHLALVKAVFKDRVLRDKELNAIPAIRGRYFYNLINDYAHLITFDPTEHDARAKRKILQPLTDTELNKIKLVIWDIWGGPFNQQKFPDLINYKIDYKKNRKIDVFFAGKSKGNQFYKWHRTQALTSIKKLKGLKRVALDGKVLRFDEYIKTIKSSKIVVSPWGLGEWCFRDFEAIHCGALVIKPDTSFVQSYPDIYQNNRTYIPCKPDFSDLEEIVRSILADYKNYNHIRKRAKKLVTHTWGLDQLAQDFVENVRQALEI